MSEFTRPIRTFFTPLCAALLLAACGGGGGGSSASSATPTPTPTPTPTLPTWTVGTFESKAVFEDLCAAPRIGTDPFTGGAYADSLGSVLHENHWLRSWSNDTYLWYNELPDLDPASYSDAVDYFDVLRTSATTASGADRDQFHFNIPSDEYFQLVSTGSGAGYGMEFSLIQAFSPRDIRIAYVEDSGPAADAGLVRGGVILEIDGEDAVLGNTQAVVDALNAGLFPEEAGESHTFLIQNPGDAEPVTVTLQTEIITSEPVLDVQTFNNGDDKVGYILFNTFGTSIAEESIVDAVTTLSTEGIDDLILDLRYNGGGFLDIASQLSYMVAGPDATSGATFESIRFNDKHPITNPVTLEAITPTPFHTTGQNFTLSPTLDLPHLDLERVFVLSTGGTCSASEAVINGLRGIDVEVVLIGTETCGKPYGFYGTGNCGQTYFTIQFQGVNNKGYGDYADGFAPNDLGGTSESDITGCTVADDYNSPLGDASEGLVSAALTYQSTGACPVVSALAIGQSKPSAPSSLGAEDSFLSQRVKDKLFLKQNRIISAPSPH